MKTEKIKSLAHQLYMESLDYDIVELLGKHFAMMTELQVKNPEMLDSKDKAFINMIECYCTTSGAGPLQRVLDYRYTPGDSEEEVLRRGFF